MLDGLQAALHSRYNLIRIDGSTPIAQRHLSIKRFKKEDSLRLALVSVTAALYLRRTQTVMWGQHICMQSYHPATYKFVKLATAVLKSDRPAFPAK